MIVLIVFYSVRLCKEFTTPSIIQSPQSNQQCLAFPQYLYQERTFNIFQLNLLQPTILTISSSMMTQIVLGFQNLPTLFQKRVGLLDAAPVNITGLLRSSSEFWHLK